MKQKKEMGYSPLCDRSHTATLCGWPLVYDKSLHEFLCRTLLSSGQRIVYVHRWKLTHYHEQPKG